MINIAVDGPAGAGKSTVARAAAERLGYIYVDTGALYRSVGLYAVRNGKNTKDASQLEPLLKELDISLRFTDEGQRVFIGEEDVSGLIRTQEISMAASEVSALPAVRAFLFDLQRDVAKKSNCIMDGRDIGTVVLPDARVKVFLTASAQARAKRRCKELLEKGVEVCFADVLAEIEERDYNDSHREIAPLKPAEGSILLDTTDLSLEQAIDALTRIIQSNI